MKHWAEALTEHLIFCSLNQLLEGQYLAFTILQLRKIQRQHYPHKVIILHSLNISVINVADPPVEGKDNF